MNKPTLPRAAFSQQLIIDALFEHPGRVVPMRALVRLIYGDASPVHQKAFRSALERLRERCPGLEIESVPGYRLRSGRTS